MARELSLAGWAVAGALVGYFAVGTGGALVGLAVFGSLGAAWLTVRPAADRRPVRTVYGLVPAAAVVLAGIFAVLLFDEYQLAGWIVIGLGVVAAPFLGRRARSWVQASVLAVGALVLAVVVGWVVFIFDVAAHGGFE